MRLFLTSFLLCFAMQVLAVNYPVPDDSFVNDWAEILDGGQEAEMRNALRDLRELTEVEFVVVTINSMKNYDYKAYDYKPFVTGLFNNWGVGNAERNDGVMILLSRDDRFVRIEVGSGYGADMNTATQNIFDRYMLKRLKNDQFANGLIEGVKAMIAEIRVRNGLSDQRSFWERYAHLFCFENFVFFGFSTLVVSTFLSKFPPFQNFVNIVKFYMARRRKLRCSTCSGDALLVSEFDKNQFLSKEDIHEERLGARKYYVYQCPKGHAPIVRKTRAIYSKYGSCASCGHLGLQNDGETIVEAASIGKIGKKEVRNRCAICNVSTSRVVTYSARSSSSRGGGSFGGGSSSGGGGGGRF